MAMVKNGQIANICQANSLLTLKEYLEDYGSSPTRTIGEKVIGEQTQHIPSEKIRGNVKAWINKIQGGERDLLL
jgi:2-iminoacetate synthase